MAGVKEADGRYITDFFERDLKRKWKSRLCRWTRCWSRSFIQISLLKSAAQNTDKLSRKNLWGLVLCLEKKGIMLYLIIYELFRDP